MSRVTVSYNGKLAKISSQNFDSFKEGIERKLNLSSGGYDPQYKDGDKWIGIYDDEDLKDAVKSTEIRVLAESQESSAKGGVNVSGHGRGVGTVYGGNVNQGDRTDNRVMAGRIAGRDYIDGDKITARNMSKVGKFEGTMHIGGKQESTSNTFSGPISGDQLHFGVGRNIKN